MICSILAAVALAWPTPTQEMKPWVYNWWMGSAVDAEGLEYQCREMAEKGFGGLHVIPIYGAKNGWESKWRSYLSPEWVEAWNLAVRTARRHNLGTDLTMGSGWCFGGPWITEENAASSGVKVKRAGLGGQGYMLDPFSATAMSNHVARFESLFGRNGTAERPRAFYHDSYEYFDAKPKGNIDVDEGMLACFGVWTDWCRRNGYLTRNEAHGAPANWLDLYALADIPETEMFGRRDRNRNPVLAKYASSAAHVKGTKLVSAETCTWVEEHFRERPQEIKLMVDQLLLAGVNHVFYHGLCYSPVDVVWPGWCFYASLEMNPRNPLWFDMGTLNAYVTRCQSIFQTWTPDNDLLLRWEPREFNDRRMARNLWNQGYQFDFISDRLLKTCDVSRYRERIDPKDGKYPQKAQPSPFNADHGLLSTRWRKDGKILHFVVNPGDVARIVRAKRPFAVMEPMTGRILSDCRMRVIASLESVMIVGGDGFSVGADVPQETLTPLPLASRWTVSPVRGGPTWPVTTNLTELASWSAWDEAFSGTMRYVVKFDGGNHHVLDLGDVRETARVTINGHELGCRILVPYRFEIPQGVLREKGNSLEVLVTSLGSNRLRWNDRMGINWKYFSDANMLNYDYGRLNAANWDVVPCGLLGPVRSAQN